MQRSGVIQTNDGVALVARGDTLSVVYSAAARLHRSRWLYDIADQAIVYNPEGIVCIMLILPTADLPDAQTRAENSTRLRKLGPNLRKLVSVPTGDLLRVRLVRTIMRGMNILHGDAHRHVVASTLNEGFTRLLEAAGPTTPPIVRLEADFRAMCDKLGIEAPQMGPGARNSSMRP